MLWCVLMQGRHLDSVLSAADVQVVIGDVECTVTSMSSTQLTCLPNVTASSSSHTADLFVCLTHSLFLMCAVFSPLF